jgi:hypothetical protein
MELFEAIVFSGLPCAVDVFRATIGNINKISIGVCV